MGHARLRLGELLDLDARPALVAEIGGQPADLLTWRHDPDRAEVEVVGIEAWIRERGVGAALLRAVRTEARSMGAERLWLITNNDNLDGPALLPAAGLGVGGRPRGRRRPFESGQAVDPGGRRPRHPRPHELELEHRLS